MSKRKRTSSSNKTHRFPREICPHCRKPQDVMPSGLFALHTVKGRWAKSMCRGSGQSAKLRVHDAESPGRKK